MLMPEYFLNSIAFIYPSEGDAKADTSFMGVGFVAGIPSPNHPCFRTVYLITAYHVIKDLQAVTLRFNTKSGGMRIVKDWPLEHWVTNLKLDIAVTPIDGDGLEFSFVPQKLFLDDQKMKHHKIGVGDEICLIGRAIRPEVRYLNHNVAMLRFGNISLAPQFEEKEFLAELRSISGHSGSPVLVYCPPYASACTRDKSQMWDGYLLLGINCSHPAEYEELGSSKDSKTKSEHFVSQTDAISQIIPAWHISDLLNTPTLAQHRVATHAELERRLTTFKEDPCLKRGAVTAFWK
jgi:hypothetical protein